MLAVEWLAHWSPLSVMNLTQQVQVGHADRQASAGDERGHRRSQGGEDVRLGVRLQESRHSSQKVSVPSLSPFPVVAGMGVALRACYQ